MLFTQPKLSHSERILRELRRKPGITARELSDRVTHKFNARISDLRKNGYIIEARRKKLPGSSVVYGYHLIDERNFDNE